MYILYNKCSYYINKSARFAHAIYYLLYMINVIACNVLIWNKENSLTKAMCVIITFSFTMIILTLKRKTL